MREGLIDPLIYSRMSPGANREKKKKTRDMLLTHSLIVHTCVTELNFRFGTHELCLTCGNNPCESCPGSLTSLQRALRQYSPNASSSGGERMIESSTPSALVMLSRGE